MRHLYNALISVQLDRLRLVFLSYHKTRPSLKLLVTPSTTSIIAIQRIVRTPLRMVRRGVTRTLVCSCNATHFTHFLLFSTLFALPDLHRFNGEGAAELLLQALSIVGLVVV